MNNVKIKKRPFITACCIIYIAIALFLFASCAEGSGNSDNIINYSGTVSSSELAQFDQLYPDLESLDACGSECYSDLYKYTVSHPDVVVKYTVPVCGHTVANSDEFLQLSPEETDVEQLLDRLAYLPCLKEISMPGTALTASDIALIRGSYPEIEVKYTVFLQGIEYEENSISSYDISSADPSELDSFCKAFPLISSLETVTVMDSKGRTSFSTEDLGALQLAAPDILFTYSFDLFGKTVTTADERIEYENADIGNSGLDEIRKVLPYLTRCTYLKLDSCGTDDDNMASLRDDFPQIKVVWRVNWARFYSCLTDAQMLHACETIQEDDAQILKYCTDVEYIDFGHNEMMSDLSFISYMPKLKVLIISDCSADTLEHLRGCKELQILEIVNCFNLTDISPLSDCTSLRFLNMSNCYNVTDLSPLYGLQLERMFLGVNSFSDKAKEELVSHLPDSCWVTLEKPETPTRVSYNYSIGWRLEEDGVTRAEWYENLRNIFRYSEDYYSYRDSDGLAHGTLNESW